jgi:hypothetical protein
MTDMFAGLMIIFVVTAILQCVRNWMGIPRE